MENNIENAVYVEDNHLEMEDEYTGVETIELKKPLEFEGIRYKTLVLDLDSLTGRDVKGIIKELSAMGDNVGSTFLETNKAYLAGVAAKAANVPIELMDELNIRDFSEVTMAVQNFLLK